jgi:type I restriction enzyme M protein
MISRVQAEFTDEVIARIERTVATWRGEGGVYEDIAGYCRSVSLAEIAYARARTDAGSLCRL